MKLCSDLGRSDWQLPSDAAALQQSWVYGAAIEAMGGQIMRFRGEDGGLAQVVFRRFGPFGFGLLSRGPHSGSFRGLDDQCTTLRRIKRALPSPMSALIVTPETDIPGLLPLVTPVSVAEIELTDQATLRAALHGKWRNRLRRAETSKLTVTITRSPDVLTALIKREQRQQSAKRYRNLPPRFLANWVRNDPKAFFIFRAMLGGEAVAEMLFLDHAPGVTYHIGWTAGAGRVLQAHHLLLWRAMCQFSDLGRSRLDLGGVDTINAPGLARFKLRTGATLRRLGTTGLVLPKKFHGKAQFFRRMS